MKSISCFEELAPFGVIALTGEACGLSYRILCDVTAKGKQLLEKALGVRDLVMHESWNRGTDSDPHIGCIMLVPEMLTALAVFALLEQGCREVWMTRGHGVFGVEPTDDEQDVHCFKTVYAEELGRRYGYFGTAGDRNVHVMTGRIH